MAQPPRSRSAYKEADLLLAILALNSGQIKSVRRAASTFNVPRTTLRDRRAGIVAQGDCEPNSKKLSKLEEEVVVSHILDLDSRGFAPSIAAVRAMADKLLSDREAGQVGFNWPTNFVKRTPRLTTRFNRPYNRQRALCEDPEILGPWFELVQRTKTQYGIADEDTYNFDEAGFMMGMISASQLVVTGSERRGRPKILQPGDREWITAILAINAAGWAIPPFLIFAGKNLLYAWFEEEEIPHDWALSVSDNGWTTNELGVAWLKHFNKHTKDRTIGTRRLLILDGHESHISLDFQAICREENIYTLCMPSHSSHLLQPLDVGCFSPLKRAYSRQIEKLMRNHINHVTKLEFLPAFKAAFDQAVTKPNICSSFRGAGLVPLHPDAVLSKLDVKLRTPTPVALPELWESKTPSNARELGAQSTLVRERIRKHQDSSPTSMIYAVDQLARGSQRIEHEVVLLRDQVSTLQRALETTTKRKQRRKKRIQNQKTLTKGEGEEIIAQRNAAEQLESQRREEAAQSGQSRQAVARCTRCREPGHNSRTCQKDTA